jgi:DNA-directed RNA polymerase specialized sigma24 family protein
MEVAPMAVYRPYGDIGSHYTASDHVWCELYTTLRPYILGWVYSSGVSSWHGQENDIVDDILQEAVIRTLKYTKLAESGTCLPIHSMTCFGRTVAHNHFRDLRRRELRLIRPTSQDGNETMFVLSQDEEVDPADIALDRLMRISLLIVLARIIVDFPLKQRTALLIDLANHADLSEEHSHLQAAFLEVGINLHDYKCVLSSDPLERSRHAASLSMAYKRLKQTFNLNVADAVL